MGALFSRPKITQQKPTPVITRDETQLQLDAADRLRRRGAGGRYANILTKRRVSGSTVTGGGADVIAPSGANGTGAGSGRSGAYGGAPSMPRFASFL